MRAFEATQHFFDIAAEQLGIEGEIREALLMPHREVQVQVTIERDDGRLAAIVRVIQTRSKTCKATLRFMRDVTDVMPLGSSAEDPLNTTLPASDADAPDEKGSESTPKRPLGLHVDGDAITLSMAAHGVTDLLVVFRDAS